MSTVRLTQGMLVQRSVSSLQVGLNRLSTAQEQLSTGRRLNRPSDSPTDTTSAMRLRSSLKAIEQYGRNASDGLGRMALIDQALTGVTEQVDRARQLALQGVSTAIMSPTSRNALAAEVDQIRADLLGQANTTYLTRPVFGGDTRDTRAYDETGAFVGVAGAITRRVGDDVKVRVDVDGQTVFGNGADSVFAELASLSTALRAGDTAALQTSLSDLADRLTTVSTAHADVGAGYKRIEQAQTSLVDKQLYLTSTLSELEDVDVARASVDLNLAEMAYQAALAATARVIQPSLLDFLR